MLMLHHEGITMHSTVPSKPRKTASTLLLASAFLALFGIYACGPHHEVELSAIDSVEIPQTPVENQFRAGFCWAYAVLGLVESDYKVRTGRSLQLSEEALAFYRMLEELHVLAQNLDSQELIQYLSTASFQGWVLKHDFFPDSFDLIEEYGIVPESAWNVKFKKPGEIEAVETVIRRKMSELIFEKVDPSLITKEEIVEKVLLARGAWETEPPRAFEYQGKRYTPKSFLVKSGFEPLDFESVTVEKPEDVEAVIAATKRALVRGISVPIGFPVHFDRLKGDTFSGKGVDLRSADNFFRDGGHAVLIDDFVNSGSREGALPLDELQEEFARPTEELSYFVFKNSWGKDAETNESGDLVSGSKTGYYRMDRDYLVGSANLTKDKSFVGILEVVVPRDIALDPFGAEWINPDIAEKAWADRN